MKSFALTLVLSVSLALPAAAFEGTVTSRRISIKIAGVAKIVGGDKKDADKILAIPADKLLTAKDAEPEEAVSTVSISGSKVRVEAAGGSFVIMDAETGTLQVVNTKDRKVMEMTKPQMKAAAEQVAGGSKMLQEQIDKLPADKRAQVEDLMKKEAAAKGQTSGPRLRPLEKSENINGYKSAAFEVKSDSETVVGWITQDAKDLATAFLTFAAAEQSIRPGPKNARMLLAEKGLPMRMQTLTAGGYQLDEIIKIEPKTISADLFKIPPGFVKTNAEGMFGATKPK